MMKRLPLEYALLLALGCAGCGASDQQPRPRMTKEVREWIEKIHQVPQEVRSVLDTPDTFTLFSIEGEDVPTDETSDTKFHGYDVLGKTEIDEVDERNELMRELYKGIEESTGPSLCFAPRHAIRALKGDDVVDLVTCFQCTQVSIFTQGPKNVGSLGVCTTDKPARMFNDVLTSHRVKLAKPPAEK